VTSDDVLASIRDALLDAAVLDDADRPDGLTLSSLGWCRSYAVRVLRREPVDGDREDARWGGMRGTMLHAGLEDVVQRVRPGWDTEWRVTWRPPGLPPLTGRYDLLADGVMVDYKTKTSAECRALAKSLARLRDEPSLAASPFVAQPCMQVTALAEATGATQGFLVLVPTDSLYFSDWRCAEVDITYWSGLALSWYGEVWEFANSAEPTDDVPRDVPAQVCAVMCDRWRTCREGYVQYEHLTDPLQQQAAWDLHDARARRKAAQADVDAATTLLGPATAVTVDERGTLRVGLVDVKETETRAGYWYLRTDLLDSESRPTREIR
jgi:hypothetical protein